MKKPIDGWTGVLVLMASGLTCYALSMSNPHLAGAELGALFNVVIPFVSTTVTLILYGITIRLERERNIILLILTLLNLLTGYLLLRANS